MEESVPQVLGEDHQDLSGLLAQLRSALNGRNLHFGFRLLDLFWARLAMHIRAENLHLFPAILAAAKSRPVGGRPTCDEVTVAIEALRQDHNFFMQELSESIQSFRAALTQEALPQGICESVSDRIEIFSKRLDRHNRLEEEQVYQWAALVLSPTQLQRLNASLRRELGNMPPRFAKS
jgi:hemerythrin-like domain-containing protein